MHTTLTALRCRVFLMFLLVPQLAWASSNIYDALPNMAGNMASGQGLLRQPGGSCRFPARWEGKWFQSGVDQNITISGNRLSNKGTCIASEGEKFLVVNVSCYRCVVIHEKHINVLQYKETFCKSRTTLQDLCRHISGDAMLFSMFRLEGAPEPCPFRGPLAFTYDRGHGVCSSPKSSVEACTEESRLLLRYQACPDVAGTESAVEELQCMATWKEGSSRYLVGKMQRIHAKTNEDRFRCFVYEQATPPGGTLIDTEETMPRYHHQINGEGVSGSTNHGGILFYVAQSGDATCNGLSSGTEGSRTMTLYQAAEAAPSGKCRFPPWLTAQPRWHTLDYGRTYSLLHRNTTLRIANTSGPPGKGGVSGAGDGDRNGGLSGGTVGVLDGAVAPMGLHQAPHPHQGNRDLDTQEMRVVCTQILESTTVSAHIVAHFTMGCESGYICIKFYRRDKHVLEVQTGTQSRRSEDACSSDNFNQTALPYVTLVTSSPEPKDCPYNGKFSVTGLVHLERHTRSPPPPRRRSLQEYNPEQEDTAPAPSPSSHRGGADGHISAGSTDRGHSRRFNKQRKQQEEREARIKAEEEAEMIAAAERRGTRTHSKRSSDRHFPQDEEDIEDDEEEDEDEESDEEEDDELDMDVHEEPPPASTTPSTVNRSRSPLATEFGNIDNLLKTKKSDTPWGRYPSREQLLQLDSKSKSTSSRGRRTLRNRRVRRGKRVRRGFGYEGPALSPGCGRTATLVMGCNSGDTMEFRQDCGHMTYGSSSGSATSSNTDGEVISSYSCHGGWEENGTNFLITTPLSRSSRGARRYCLMYHEVNGVLLFSSSARSCIRPDRSTGFMAGAAGRAPFYGGPIAFNGTNAGNCVEANAASALHQRSRTVLSAAVASFAILLLCIR